MPTAAVSDFYFRLYCRLRNGWLATQLLYVQHSFRCRPRQRHIISYILINAENEWTVLLKQLLLWKFAHWCSKLWMDNSFFSLNIIRICFILMTPLFRSLMNKSHCPWGRKMWNLMRSSSSFCLSFHSSPDRQAAKNPFSFREPNECDRNGNR